VRAVEAAPLVHRGRDQRLAIGLARNVGFEEFGLAAGVLYEGGRFFENGWL